MRENRPKEGFIVWYEANKKKHRRSDREYKSEMVLKMTVKENDARVLETGKISDRS